MNRGKCVLMGRACVMVQRHSADMAGRSSGAVRLELYECKGVAKKGYVCDKNPISLMVSVVSRIAQTIRKIPRGSLFFTEDFLHCGTAKSVSKTLERMANDRSIVRVARGIYARLEIDPVLGPVFPGTEAIAEAISRRDKARIMPAGVSALHALGLSTQVPMHVVYLTDGAARKISIGRRKIIFRKTTPKNLAAIGDVSRMAIQAMKEIGKDHITAKEIAILLRKLSKENPKHLVHDIRLAPEWIRVIMRRALIKSASDD